MIKVLIVEDDPMVAQLNKRYVENIEGFKVIDTAKNGEEALKVLKVKSIDLIILDMYMPKVDGITFLKEMRRRFIKTDVILVTAAKETENFDEVLKLGAVDYLIKPFEYERFKNALDNYASRHQLLSEKNTIEQEDIDKIIRKNKNKIGSSLQKGLHKKTLERIRNSMKDNHDKFYTSEEIAEKLLLSRVTVRKYLEYLVSIEEIKLEVEYGAVGRPSHLYKYKE